MAQSHAPEASRRGQAAAPKPRESVLTACAGAAARLNRPLEQSTPLLLPQHPFPAGFFVDARAYDADALLRATSVHNKQSRPPSRSAAPASMLSPSATRQFALVLHDRVPQRALVVVVWPWRWPSILLLIQKNLADFLERRTNANRPRLPHCVG